MISERSRLSGETLNRCTVDSKKGPSISVFHLQQQNNSSLSSLVFRPITSSHLSRHRSVSGHFGLSVTSMVKKDRWSCN